MGYASVREGGACVGRTARMAPFFWVYQRADKYTHMINASSERIAREMLNVLPQPYTILAQTTSMAEAHERIQDERHADL